MKWQAVMMILLWGMLPCNATAAGQGEETERSDHPKWHIRGQFAGFQGLISAGMGPVWGRGVWRPALMYGYAPPLHGRTRVHQIILRNDVVFRARPRHKDLWVSPVLSASLLLETGDHTYLSLPDQFPKGYYHPPQAHGTFGAGARLNKRTNGTGPFRELSFATEFVALDTYLWYAISQRGAPLNKAFGLSFALATAF